MLEIDRELRNTINTLCCPKHNVRPDISEHPNGKLKLNCCCAEFKVQCFHILKKLMESSASEDKDIDKGL